MPPAEFLQETDDLLLGLALFMSNIQMLGD